MNAHNANIIQQVTYLKIRSQKHFEGVAFLTFCQEDFSFHLRELVFYHLPMALVLKPNQTEYFTIETINCNIQQSQSGLV